MLVITGGSLKGKRFSIPASWPIRPTTALVRQAVFQRVSVQGCRFLDLYAGSGLMTWEAYSRGANQLVCVEQDRRHSRHLHTQATAWQVPVTIHTMPVERFLARDPLPAFDVVFMDPPYAYESWAMLLPLLAAWVHADSTIVIEHDREAVLPAMAGSDTRLYGDTAITIITGLNVMAFKG
jgi:16S rRNA (guanine966-N2)-methyltransferase